MIALASGVQWLNTIAGFGVGTIVVAIVMGLFNKRKLSAEATKIITDAASGVVAIQSAELARMLADNTLLHGEVNALKIEQAGDREWRRKVDQMLAMHGLWDAQVVEMASAAGIELPPSPPLTIGS